MGLFKRIALTVLGAVGLLFVAALPLQNSVTVVANTTALRAIPTTAAYGGSVLRTTDGVAGAPPMFFFPGSSACSTDDGAICVNSSDGNHWSGQFLNHVFDVRQFGIVGNGSTDITSALQNVINDAPQGAELYFPSAGSAYTIATGVTVAYGKSLKVRGDDIYVAPLTPFDNVEADWTGSGTWMKCQSTSVPCWLFNGNGWKFSGINFWQTQPTPAVQTQCGNPCTMTSGWTPTVYGPLIEVNGAIPTSGTTGLANYWDIDHVVAANCDSSPGCIEIIGSNGSGTVSSVSPHLYSHFDHNYIGNLGVGLYEEWEDNDIVMVDDKFELPWENYSSSVLYYTEGNSTSAGHKIDESWNYVAGQVQIGVEHDFSAIGIQAQNQQITEPFGTLQIGAQAFSLLGENFNEVCRAIYTPATSGSPSAATVFQGVIQGGILSTDFLTSPVAGQCANGTGAPNALDLQSTAVSLQVSGLQAYDVQTLLNSTGSVFWTGANTLSYSNYSNGGNAIVFGSGNNIQLSGVSNLITLNSNAGLRYSGTPSPTTFASGLSIDGPSGSIRRLNFTHLGSPASGGGLDIEDWDFREDTSGNMALFRYGPTGSFVDVPIGVSTSTGLLSVNDGLLTTIVEQGTYTIGGTLPTCSTVGPSGAYVSNGILSPTFQQVVSTTGTTTQHVTCNGSSWVYQ